VATGEKVVSSANHENQFSEDRKGGLGRGWEGQARPAIGKGLQFSGGKSQKGKGKINYME